MSELLVLGLKFAFLALLWVFILFAGNVIRTDLFGRRVPKADLALAPAPRLSRRRSRKPRPVPTTLRITQGAQVASTLALGKPLSKATRSRKDSAKSNSPAIERSVIAATWSFKPLPAAISSIHSMVMRVESMSLMMRPKSEKGTSGKMAASMFCASSHCDCSVDKAKSSAT